MCDRVFFAMLAYHDEEWGVPSHDDRHLFEMLVLEGAQAGLSWNTIRAGCYPSSLGEATVDAIAGAFLVGVIALSLWANRRSLLNN